MSCCHALWMRKPPPSSLKKNNRLNSHADNAATELGSLGKFGPGTDGITNSEYVRFTPISGQRAGSKKPLIGQRGAIFRASVMRFWLLRRFTGRQAFCKIVQRNSVSVI